MCKMPREPCPYTCVKTTPRLTKNGSGVDGGSGTDTTVGRHTGLHAVGMGLERRSTWARQHLEGAGRSM